jgi:hypothetical protein
MKKPGMDQENEGDRRTNAHTHTRTSFDQGFDTSFTLLSFILSLLSMLKGCSMLWSRV